MLRKSREQVRRAVLPYCLAVLCSDARHAPPTQAGEQLRRAQYAVLPLVLRMLRRRPA